MAVVASQAVAFDKTMLTACRRSATLSEWSATLYGHIEVHEIPPA
jgi:hypothetical protein